MSVTVDGSRVSNAGGGRQAGRRDAATRNSLRESGAPAATLESELVSIGARSAFSHRHAMDYDNPKPQKGAEIT